MTPKQIGATVKAIRIELGLTTAALGKKVGVSQPQIWRLEHGQHEFRSDTLVKIAKQLKVPPFRFFMNEKEWAKWQRAR